MTVIILDSNIAIQVMRGNQLLLKWLSSLDGAIYFPSVVVMELIRGCRTREEREAVEQFVTRHGLIYYPTERDHYRAMQIIDEHYRAGDELGVVDAIIAACAMKLHAKLYTSDKNLHRVRGLKAEAPYKRPAK